MQFVNTTKRTIYTSFSGTLNPGQVSPDGGLKRKRLEDALAEVVRICGDSLGIRLNAREAELLEKLISLDEKGCAFDASQLPAALRDDPTGEKRSIAAAHEAQQRELNALADANAAAAGRERLINGETAREPVGPATLKGEKVNPSDLKSGFEQIMEENARIAQGAPKKDIGEVLDPIGVHARTDGAFKPEAVDMQVPGGTPVSVSQARNLDGDGTRSADATVPQSQAPERGSAMDRQAAEIANGLSTVGPVDAKAKKGKGKKAK